VNKRSGEKLKSVIVFLEFDQPLQSVTGITRTSIEVTEGTPFIMLLQAVLDSYPDLVQRFDFRALGFEVNGRVPNPHFLLSAHDVVSFGLQHDDGDLGSDGDMFYH
jgi:hypothetical protein